MSGRDDDYLKPAKSNYPVSATYNYVNGRKELHMRVRRHERDGNKEFSQQFHFQKEWHNGKPAGRKYPYRLQHIIDAPPDVPIYICEGEKDADNLAALGLLATTNSEGAGKFTNDLVPWFQGRDNVFILQDNDDRGRDHARQVACLLKPVVGSVRIVAFDEVPEAEDVSWWLDHGGTKEALLERAMATPHFADVIAASAFTLPDAATIPRREWVYWPHYIRGYVSLTLAPGGVGKSALIVAETLAMATGRPLLGVNTAKPRKVWYLNLEDPMDELHRRFAAAALHYGVTKDQIGDRLYLNSGRTTPFVLATERNRSAIVDQHIVRSAVDAIQSNGIDVVVVDPFVASHRLQENDNAQIDQLARTYAQIAEETQTAVMLVHHTRKMGVERGTVDDGRGASSLLAASRSARLLTGMTSKEASDAGIEDRERRFYFRADHGKANLTPPAESAMWFRIRSVDLGNESRDADRGDNVGVVTTYSYPKVDQLRLSEHDLRRVLAAITATGPWREDQRANAWVGQPIAKALGLGAPEGPTKRQVLKLIKEWTANGILIRVKRKDAKSIERDFLEAGEIPSVEASAE